MVRLLACLLVGLQPPAAAAAAAAAWWSCCLAELPAVTQSKVSGHEVHGCPLMAKEMPEAASRTGSTSSLSRCLKTSHGSIYFLFILLTSISYYRSHNKSWTRSLGTGLRACNRV